MRDIDESLTEASIDNLSSVVIDSDEILMIQRGCVCVRNGLYILIWAFVLRSSCCLKFINHLLSAVVSFSNSASFARYDIFFILLFLWENLSVTLKARQFNVDNTHSPFFTESLLKNLSKNAMMAKKSNLLMFSSLCIRSTVYPWRNIIIYIRACVYIKIHTFSHTQMIYGIFLVVHNQKNILCIGRDVMNVFCWMDLKQQV